MSLLPGLLAVAVGGAIGSVARLGVALMLAAWAGRPMPWSATLAVNLAGCLAIGLLLGPLGDRLWVTPLTGVRADPATAPTPAPTPTPTPTPTPAAATVRAFVLIGVLGGFTTFSTFAVDAVRLIERREWALAAGYVLASNVGGLLLTAAGIWLSAWISLWLSPRAGGG